MDTNDVPEGGQEQVERDEDSQDLLDQRDAQFEELKALVTAQIERSSRLQDMLEERDKQLDERFRDFEAKVERRLDEIEGKLEAKLASKWQEKYKELVAELEPPTPLARLIGDAAAAVTIEHFVGIALGGVGVAVPGLGWVFGLGLGLWVVWRTGSGSNDGLARLGRRQREFVSGCQKCAVQRSQALSRWRYRGTLSRPSICTCGEACGLALD